MKYTYKQILDSLPVKKNSNSSWWVRLWVRKASFPLTFVAINMGLTSNEVSILSIFVTIVASVFFAMEKSVFTSLAVVLVNLWLILDCVDGNIARCKSEKTIYGEFIDDLGGYFTVAFIYFSLGVYVYKNGGMFATENDFRILCLGAISSICDILARLIHKDYRNFSLYAKSNVNKEIAQKRSLSYIRKRIGKELGISGLFMPLVILGAVFNFYDVITIFYLCFNLFALISTSIIYIYKAARYDRKNQEG